MYLAGRDDAHYALTTHSSPCARMTSLKGDFKMPRTILAFSLLGLVLTSIISAAQAKEATISGTVRSNDGHNTPIPGVKVTLTNLDRTDVKQAITNREAEYSLQTTAGRYELRGELPGFETAVQSQ